MNLADSVVDKYGAVLKNLRNNDEERVIDEKTALKIKEMMEKTVTDGTATGAKSHTIAICGKTGSAETGWIKNGQTLVHGWFCGFFPKDNPKYAMAVFCENGQSGAQSCVPLFLSLAEKIMLLE